MTYITETMLYGIAIINTEFFNNTNDKIILNIKLTGIAKIRVYHIVSRTKTRDKIAIIYNMLIIYSSKNDTLESVET